MKIKYNAVPFDGFENVPKGELIVRENDAIIETEEGCIYFGFTVGYQDDSFGHHFGTETVMTPRVCDLDITEDGFDLSSESQEKLIKMMYSEIDCNLVN